LTTARPAPSVDNDDSVIDECKNNVLATVDSASFRTLSGMSRSGGGAGGAGDSIVDVDIDEVESRGIPACRSSIRNAVTVVSSVLPVVDRDKVLIVSMAVSHARFPQEKTSWFQYEDDPDDHVLHSLS
jgi:hypothetical protein